MTKNVNCTLNSFLCLLSVLDVHLQVPKMTGLKLKSQMLIWINYQAQAHRAA